jgi:hypothetical protein
MSPPPSLMTSTGIPAKIRPYDGDDASMIISSVQNRTRTRSNAGIQATPAYGGSTSEEVTSTPASRNNQGGSPRSIGRALGAGHRRNPSGSNPSSLPAKPLAAALFDVANGGPSSAHHLANAVAAEAAAGHPIPEDLIPDFTHTRRGSNTTLAALKNLPLNPMASAPRGVRASPDLKAGNNLSGGATAAATTTTATDSTNLAQVA